MRFAALLFVVFVSSGCAGIGVATTSDPLKKLNDAEDLFVSQGRPLLAETLIREAMVIYQERGDSQGLGHANREYADLLLSPTVAGKWSKYYRENGFQDKTVTFDNRAEKAAEYYTKAIEHYARAVDQVRKNNRYDSLTNVYYNTAESYIRLNDRANACRYYKETLGAYEESIRRNPSVKPYSPTGTVADLVAAGQKRAGCV